MHLTIRLLGEFALFCNDEAITTVNTPRLQALLAYLFLHGNSPHSRHRVAAQLWPDSSEEQALTNLRKHLLHLKKALPNANSLLLSERHMVGWSPQVVIQLDIHDFKERLATAKRLKTEEADYKTAEATIVVLQQAIDLYQGDLLPTCYDEWILPIQKELQDAYFFALERLSELLEAQRRYDEAIQTSQRMVAVDGLHEATYRRLLRLYALKGDRAAALRTYHSCSTQLRQELGVDPDDETQAIYERVLHGTDISSLQPTQPLHVTQPELAAYAPFIGRQNEWQRLQHSWRLALRGQAHFVLIAGEAGIGKTRLAEELLQWAIHQGVVGVRARCYAAEGRLTYAPIIEWLRAEPLRSQRAKLAATWLSELARLLPEILQENPALPAPPLITQSVQRHHLFEAATRAIVAGEQALLLLIDDLQWCDKETLELLHFLLRNATTMGQTRLLLVGTARLPDEVDSTHPLYDLLTPLRASDSVTQLDLTRLNQTETSDLARQMSKEELAPNTLHQLFQETAGNPLFVVETMRATQGVFPSNSAPSQSDPSDTLPFAEREPLTHHLPPKVLAVIQARLSQLSATARELCEWAAIIGRAFTLDLLISASQIATNKAVNALDELWQRRIVREQGSDAYDFSHDRIRDVAAAGISRVRRKYLHRCVAGALEQEFLGQLDSIAARIAAHYDTAGIVEKAIEYYRLAAEHAPLFYANDETVTLLQRAIVLLKTLPESQERDRQELSLLIAMGPALASVTNPAITRFRQVYERAYLLSQQLAVPLPHSLLRILATHKLSRLNFVEVEQIGEQLCELAKPPSGEVDLLLDLEGRYLLGVAAFWQGHFLQAKAFLQQVVDSYSQVRQTHHVIEYGVETGIYCRTRLGWTLWYLGYPDQSRQQCEISMQLAQQQGHSYTLDF